MPTTPADTVSAAYARGISEGSYNGDHYDRVHDESAFAPLNLRPVELRSAVDSWTSAQSEHAHTSFYGARHIRLMRAYWLGRMRATRA